MRKLKFYKEPSGSWFVDLPEWTGEKAELQMIAGADTMLDYMAEDNDYVWLYISEEKFEGCDTLEFIRLATELENGAFYKMNMFKGIELNLDVFLCDVTLFVFNNTFPKQIFISKLD